MIRIIASLITCYHWSLTRPQAIGYGIILVIAAQFRVGDALLLTVGIVAIAGGLVGAWRYVMK